ncbi:MAG: TRAP transporter large permease subunit [Chloroflexota bacterium]
MPWEMLLVLVFLGLFILMLAGLPIAFSLGLSGIIAILLYWPEGLRAVGLLSLQAGKTFEFIAVPMFILMGSVITFSGFGRDFYDTVQKWTRALPGSLAVATMVMSSAFAALTGSSTANTAAIGTMTLPEMAHRNYNMRLAAGVVAAGGALGILIPPSLAMIIYGMMAQKSVAKLFMAGVIPGIIMTIIFIIYIVIRCLQHPDWAPRLPPATWREKMFSLYRVWGLLFLVLLVLGTIYMGIATPTEASAIGALGALILALVYRQLNWANIRRALLATVNLTTMVMFIVVGGLLFSKVLITMGLAQQLAKFFAELPVNRWVIVVGFNIMFLVLGCFVDPTSLIIIFIPLLAPILEHLGFDLIWFGVILTINMEVANLTPPVGYNLFVLKAVAPDIGFGDIVRGVIPFIIMYIFGIGLVMLFPQLALWLPRTMRI